MRALVVFESMFGNTETIARAVADGLRLSPDISAVDVVEVGSAPPTVCDVCMVVVGGPTHGFGLSRANTRLDAGRRAEGAPLVSRTIGIREWLEQLERPLDRLAVAATFDTRIRRPLLPGSAAKAAARRLRKLGFAMRARPASFWVDGVAGPLLPGEVERARRWGAQLGGAQDRVGV